MKRVAHGESEFLGCKNVTYSCSFFISKDGQNGIGFARDLHFSFPDLQWKLQQIHDPGDTGAGNAIDSGQLVDDSELAVDIADQQQLHAHTRHSSLEVMFPYADFGSTRKIVTVQENRLR